MWNLLLAVLYRLTKLFCMKPIREYFSFSASDRNGMIIVILILWTIVLLPRYWPEKQISQDEAARFIALSDSLRKQQRPIASYKDSNKESRQEGQADKKPAPAPAKLFPFNPNELDYQTAVALGIRSKLARTIEKYLAKGGSFHKASDLKKIYGMGEETYARLEPYVRFESSKAPPKSKSMAIAESSPAAAVEPGVQQSPKKATQKLPEIPKEFQKKKKKKRKKKWQKNPIDINKSDTAQWKKIRGIGSVLASRIVKYRDLLGGFVRKEQIREVYGIEEQLAQEIDEVLFTDVNFKPKQININTAEFGQLLKHPYVAYEDAQKIVNLRQKGGDFGNIEEIKFSNAMDHGMFEKLRPYLTVN